MNREMETTRHLFCNAKDVPDEKITAVEGVDEQGDLTVKVLHVGDELLVLEVFRKQGLIDPLHKHDDHESCGYLIEGQMRIVVGGEEHVAGPGSSWRHPIGIEHYSEALTDCLQIEIKSPPKKTWTSE